MILAHLTETEIQLYITEPEAISSQLATHVEGCSLCQSKAANYVLLFKNIHDETKPEFDFNLSALVLERLPVPKHSFPWAAILVSILSFALIAISAIFFGSALVAIVRRISGVLLTITATGTGMIIAFQAIEMLKEHQKRMQNVLLQKTLQL